MSQATQEMRAPPAALSFEEFLEGYDGVRAEWVDGTVVEMSPASDRHQDVLELLAAAMRELAEHTQAGIVRSQQFTMRIGDRGRVPDLLFLAAEHLDRRKPTHVEGPADLVLEVVSLDSRIRDRGEKLYEYEQAGVPEYWLVDPLRKTVELYRLNERGLYVQVPPGASGRLESRVLKGFWLDPAWVLKEPLPTVRWVVRQWGVE